MDRLNQKKLSLTDIKKIPFFYDMSDTDLTILSDYLTIREQDKLRYIFKEGDAPAGMYFVLEGLAKVVKRVDNDIEVTLEEISSPQFFGEISLIESRRRGASVVTLSKFKAVELTCENFHVLKEYYPQIALNIVVKIAHTLAFKLRKLTNETKGTI